MSTTKTAPDFVAAITRNPQHPASSKIVDWKASSHGETFCSFAGNFDIDAAKDMLRAKPRSIESLPLAAVQDLLHPREGLFAFRVAVEWERVDSDASIDLEIPVIIADLGKTCLPIDGWHRIAKGIEQGLETLPCVVLSKRETAKVRS